MPERYWQIIKDWVMRCGNVSMLGKKLNYGITESCVDAFDAAGYSGPTVGGAPAPCRSADNADKKYYINLLNIE